MRLLLLRVGFTLVFAALAACGSVAAKEDAGPSDDARPADAQVSVIDASGTPDARPPDARPPVTGPPSQEITSGGARVSGGDYQVDVQLGHWMKQAPSTGGDTKVEGAAAVKE